MILFTKGGNFMPFHKNLGSYRGADIPKGGVKISNSDILHSSRHRKMGTKKRKMK